MYNKNFKRFTLTLCTLTSCAVAALGQINYNFNDGQVPAGTAVSGVAKVADDGTGNNVLHLTDDGQVGVNGMFVIPDLAGGKRVGSLNAHWRSLIGGVDQAGESVQFGTGGADGYSFNWGADVPASGVGEEGGGTGISVTVDTFDNGGGEAPGIEIKYKGNRVAFDPINSDQTVAKAALRKNQFVDAALTVDNNSATATFTYDGHAISAALPGWAGIAGGSFVFGARTGGAQDNHWIDDLSISATVAELQTNNLVLLPVQIWRANTNGLTPAGGGTDLTGTGWEQPGYGDSTAAWFSGIALFGHETTPAEYLPYTFPPASFIPSTAEGGPITVYFRTHFTWSGDPANVTLMATNLIDDSAVYYLNGVEVARIRVPANQTGSTYGDNNGTEGVPEITTWAPGALRNGDNVIAVELHNTSASSSDDVFGLSLIGLSPLAPTITDTAQPSNRTVFANRTTTLQVSAIGSPAPTYQWYKDGSPIDPLVNATATSASFVIPNMSPPDQGNYFVRISNPVGTADSRTAVVTYINDAIPPALVRAVGNATFDAITVEFDELIDPSSAGDNFSYQITDGVNTLTAISVVFNPGGKSVTLLMDPATPLTENTLYTVTVATVADLAGNVAQNISIRFRSWVLGTCNGLLFEAYDTSSTPGTALSFLLSHPNYPNNPRDRYTITVFDSLAAYPDFSHEQYGARIRGLFIPPISGNWVFYLASDDPGQLYLNPNGPSAAGKVLVVQETGCCIQWAAKTSLMPAPTGLGAPIPLVAGQGYYIEGLYKEGGGGDYLKIAARLESEPAPSDDPNQQLSISTNSIPGGWLGYPAAPAGVGGPLTIQQQPTDVTTLANTLVSFTVGAAQENGLPICYQWRRDGTPIAGANGPSYSFGPVTVADNGAHFDCQVAAIGTSTATRAALLRVNEDTNSPACVSASASLILTNIVVRFSEFVDSGTAQDNFNYTVSGGLSVDRVTTNADGMSVTLALGAPLNVGASYQVTIQNVTDLAGNTINPNPCTLSFRTPVISCGFLVFQAYRPESTSNNNLDTTLLVDPNFPSKPNEVLYMSAFDTRTVYPNDSHEGYGALMFGYFIPPVSGNWIFYLRSDDSSRLFLNPNGSDPAGKQLLTAEETTCCEAFSAHSSAPQALTAGQQYHIEALLKEGTGGDFCQVAAKLDTDPTNPDTLQPISGAYLAAPADPTGVSVSITQQPLDKVAIVGGSYFEDFNTGDGGYTVQTPAAFQGAWAYDSASGAWHEDGQESDDAHPNTSFLTSPTLTVSASGPVTLTFVHRYSFEFDGTRWDGGQLRISVNGGPFTAVPDAAFTQNGYGGNTVAGNSQSELHGQEAFTADSPGYASGYITSIANLGNFNAGDTVRIQFMAASDTNTRGKVPNWQIDSVGATGLQGSQLVTFSTAISTSGNGPVFYQWYRDSGSGFVPIQGANSASYSLLPACSDSGARFRVQVYVPGALVTSQPATVTVTAPNTTPLFVLTPPPAVNEDSGAQTVAGTAHDILAGTGSVSVSTPSIGLNFGADEVAGTSTGTLSPGVKAGVVQQGNWNNLTGASGNASGVVADYSGTPIGTVVSVTWSSPNTWSSTGRGEENNGFPAGGDRTLMTGYLDTTDQAAGGASVTVSGIGS